MHNAIIEVYTVQPGQMNRVFSAKYNTIDNVERNTIAQLTWRIFRMYHDYLKKNCSVVLRENYPVQIAENENIISIINFAQTNLLEWNITCSNQLEEKIMAFMSFTNEQVKLKLAELMTLKGMVN